MYFPCTDKGVYGLLFHISVGYSGCYLLTFCYLMTFIVGTVRSNWYSLLDLIWPTEWNALFIKLCSFEMWGIQWKQGRGFFLNHDHALSCLDMITKPTNAYKHLIRESYNINIVCLSGRCITKDILQTFLNHVQMCICAWFRNLLTVTTRVATTCRRHIVV
jgi:hypothetical protein